MSIHRANITSSPSGRFVSTALAATIAALCVSSGTVQAQFEITTGVGNTAQDFNGLISTGTNQTWTNDTTLPPPDLTSTLDGWSLFNFTPNPITTYSAGTGSSGTGSFYSFGLNAADRALGGVGSGGAYFGSPLGGAVAGYIAFAATNSSGGNIAKFTLGFDGEQWRNGGNTSAQTMVFEYGIGTTIDAVTSWSSPGGNFNWASTVNTATAAAVDGNVAGLVAGRGGTVNGLTWGNGQTLWLRWVELNDGGNDHGLAIDNFAFSWETGTLPRNLTWAGSNGTWDTTAISWTDETPAPSAFNPGDSVNFTNSGIAQSAVTIAAGGVNPGLVAISHTSGTYTISGGAITSAQALQKTGGGTLVLGSTFSQGLNAQGGVVRLAAGGGFGDGSSITLDGTDFDLNGNSDSVGALVATDVAVTTGGANLTVNGPATLTDASITTGAGLLTINGNVTVPTTIANVPTTISGRLSTGTAGRTYTIVGGASDLDLDLDADLEGTGRVAFAGFGKIRIGGNNSAQTGGFRLNSPIIYVVESPTAFGNTQLFLNGGIFDAGIVLTGANKITTPVSLGGSLVEFAGEDVEFGGTVSFFDSSNKALVIEDGQTVTFSGTLDSGVDPFPNSNITKHGDGTLVLRANANAYTGDISVEVGEVVAAIAGALGSGDITVGVGVDTDPVATLTVTASQTIASLNIGDNGLVVLTAAPPVSAAPAAASPIPEPSGAALLVCGVLGLLGRRRKRA